MKKYIIVAGFVENGKTVYEYIKKNYSNKEVEITYLDYNKETNSKFENIKNKINQIMKIGLIKFIRFAITKEAIVISEGGSPKHTLISKNIICLNHGWGTKSTFSNKQINDEIFMKSLRLFIKSKPRIVCLSEFDSEYYMNYKVFDDLERPEFLPIGMPRNDYLIENMNNIEIKINIAKKLGINRGSDKIILYSPTHRDDELRDIKLYDKIIQELKALDREIEGKGVKILFRPHQFINSAKKDVSEFKNIYYVGFDDYPDPRDLMIYSDLLITDYSSIFVDYLLLNKPIVFYNFDMSDYLKYRGLVIDYNNKIHTPGPKINNLKEILELTNEDFIKYDLIKSREFFHKYNDGKSTERTVDLILDRKKIGV